MLIIPVWLYGQTGLYKPLGGGMYNGTVWSLAVDSTDNTLYMAGVFNLLGGYVSDYVAKWDGTTWDSIPQLPNSIKHFQYIDGTLYAYGDQSIWKKNAGTWTEIASVTDYNGITGIAKYNGNIVIMGSFDSLNTVPLNYFAQYDGSNLLTFSNHMIWPMYGGNFSTAVVYNNELYVGGLFTDTTGTIRNLMKWNGSQWVSIGTSIVGTFARVFKLIVYDNKLFIAGEFNKASGNVGNAIFSYDGTNFNDLGGGLQLAITDMAVQNNQLYMVGACSAYSGRQFKGFLSFNGTDFCFYDSVPCNTTPGSLFSKIIFYNDSLIVGGAKYAYNGDTINNIGIFRGDYTLSQDCEQVIGVDESEQPNSSLNVYPNPTTDQLTIELIQMLNNPVIQIKNILGQTVYSQKDGFIEGKTAIEINVEGLTNGIYLIQLSDEKMTISKKLLKQ
ncbi:MAG: hypothetical protein JWO44_1009 [Bacteroidetes bacterium]|nr:hypothetical protein [Bacteroidota bacterium]